MDEPLQATGAKQLSVPQGRLGRRIVLFLLAVGAVASLLFAVLLLGTIEARRDSVQTQAGPRVVGTIVSLGATSGAYQQATFSYEDSSGSARTVTLEYPLDFAAHAQVGMTSTIVYDPSDPARAELEGIPGTTNRDVLRSFGLFAVVAGSWLAVLMRFVALTRGAALRRRHLLIAVGVIAALLVTAGRFIVSFTNERPTGVAFAPYPPATAAAQPKPVPSLLSAKPPASGPLVTAAQARAIVDAVWPLRDEALASRDVSTLREIETQPALIGDLSRMDDGGSPDRPVPDQVAPADMAVYVPRQTTWPIRFLAEAATTSVGQPFLERMVFARTSPADSWHVVLDSGEGQPTPADVELDPGIFDSAGYDVVPAQTAVPSWSVAASLAGYWQSWLDVGAAPASGPQFSPGLWTTEFGEQFAGQQDSTSGNGLPTHITYGDPATPPGDFWTFGVYGNEDLVCTPVFESKTWTGQADQDANREHWGPELAPGVYQSITADFIREPCVFETPTGVLIVTGADRWNDGESGERL